MRFRLGLLIGGLIGYYLGTRAPKERAEQLERLVGRARAAVILAIEERRSG